ncbi:MAG: hypothetical protein Q4G33_11400 [bacterium]|nr:hypothetical protein [bacterium]
MNTLTTPDYILENLDTEFPVLAIPKWLFDEQPYKDLSDDARLVYALLLKSYYGIGVLRGYAVIGTKLELNNSLATVQCMLACRKRTAKKVVTELADVNLVSVVN